MDRSLKAHRALLHPLWLSALTLLALNDHFLKGSGLLSGAITGKLSDFAGLVVAPALLAVILQLSSRRALVAAHLATGLVFAAVKVAPPAAHALAWLMELGPFHAQIVVDPTDLFALPALLVSFAVLVPVMARPHVERPLTQRALLIGGTLACAATSQVSTPCGDGAGMCSDGIPRESAALVLGNTTSAQRLMRVRALKDSVIVDCDKMLVDPTGTLSRELFADAQTWLIEPERGLPLQNRPTCSAYLIDADGMDLTLLAWSESDFFTADLSTSTTAPDNGRMIGIQLSSTGKLVLGTHPAVHQAPPLDPPAPTGECAIPDATVGIEWSLPLPKSGALTTSPDGCHSMTIDDGDAKQTFYLCVPKEAMPFAEGDIVSINPMFFNDTFAEAGERPTAGEGLILRSEGKEILVVRGNTLAHRSMDAKAEHLSEPTTTAQTGAGCLGAHDACGSLSIPLEVSLTNDHVPDTIAFLRAGQSLSLGDGYGTLFVVRAEEMPIRDTACPPATTEERHFESVLVVAPVATP
jgi:hypothetical protein